MLHQLSTGRLHRSGDECSARNSNVHLYVSFVGTWSHCPRPGHGDQEEVEFSPHTNTWCLFRAEQLTVRWAKGGTGNSNCVFDVPNEPGHMPVNTRVARGSEPNGVLCAARFRGRTVSGSSCGQAVTYRGMASVPCELFRAEHIAAWTGRGKRKQASKRTRFLV